MYLEGYQTFLITLTNESKFISYLSYFYNNKKEEHIETKI